MTTWTETTIARIESGTLAEPIIRTMRIKLANALNRETKLPHDDVYRICEAIETARPLVTAEQARKGADWLYKSVFTSRGVVRNTDFAREFSADDRAVILALREFRLIELRDIGAEHSRWSKFAPVYRAYGAGMYFDYVAQAWQTGQSFIQRHAVQP